MEEIDQKISLFCALCDVEVNGKFLLYHIPDLRQKNETKTWSAHNVTLQRIQQIPDQQTITNVTLKLI